MTSLILASIGVFLGVILLLVIILLVAKGYLTPSGEVRCLPTMCSFHRLVVVKVLADNAAVRCSKGEERFFLLKPDSSLANSKLITGVWVAR